MVRPTCNYLTDIGLLNTKSIQNYISLIYYFVLANAFPLKARTTCEYRHTITIQVFQLDACQLSFSSSHAAPCCYIDDALAIVGKPFIPSSSAEEMLVGVIT